MKCYGSINLHTFDHLWSFFVTLEIYYYFNYHTFAIIYI